MELIAALLVAAPAGFFIRSRRTGLLAYLVVWALLFPVQTVVVYTDTAAKGDDWEYFAMNAIILAAGLGLNRLGAVKGMRHRRAAPSRPLR